MPIERANVAKSVCDQRGVAVLVDRRTSVRAGHNRPQTRDPHKRYFSNLRVEKAMKVVIMPRHALPFLPKNATALVPTAEPVRDNHLVQKGSRGFDGGVIRNGYGLANSNLITAAKRNLTQSRKPGTDSLG
jgi:hypothetical protein